MTQVADEVRASLRSYLRLLPATVRAAFLRDGDVRDATGLPAHDVVMIGSHRVALPALHAVARAFVNRQPLPPLLDLAGQDLAVVVEEPWPGALLVRIEGVPCVVEHACLFSGDAAVRTAALDAAIEGRTLPPATETRLRTDIAAAPPSDERFDGIVAELETAPEAWLGRLFAAFRRREPLGVTDLVPEADATFARFTPERGAATSLGAFARGSFTEARRHAVARDPVRGILFHAPAFVSPALGLAGAVEGAPPDAVEAAVRDMAAAGDPFSLLAALDLCAEHADQDSFVTVGAEVLDRLFGEPERTAKVFGRFAAAAFVAMGTVNKRGMFADEPLFYRRLAALIFAGHLTRVFAGFRIAPDKLFGAALGAYADEVLVGGWRERREAPHWRPEWLTPEALADYALARARAIVSSARKATPDAWGSRINAGVERMRDLGRGPRMLQPRPLDEFADAWEGLPALTSAEALRIVEALDAPGFESAADTVTALAFSSDAAVADRASLSAALCRRSLALDGGGARGR